MGLQLFGRNKVTLHCPMLSGPKYTVKKKWLSLGDGADFALREKLQTHVESYNYIV